VTDALAALLAREPLAVTDGIARFVDIDDEGQRQTAESFAFKWSRRESYGSVGNRDASTRWLLERYGFESVPALREHLAAAATVLDAGCGSGWTASLWLTPGWSSGRATWVGADISRAVDLARERLAGIEDVHFVQADVLALPFRAGSFGAIVAEGVLHHTPSTERAFQALVPLLHPGGELLFYVYRRKAPVRELADDYVREQISSLPPEAAWEALRPLTELARALAELRVEVEVPAVPVLGIEGGRHDIQRLVYWNFAKLFWNDDLTFEENLHVNFDWYHPRYAHRHTEDEVRRWCADAGLEITRFHVGPSGFTVRAVRS
jgi:arsenite methyltransferase